MATLTLGDAIKLMKEQHDDEIAELDEYIIEFTYETIIEGLDDLDI